MIFESVRQDPTREEKLLDAEGYRDLAAFPLATPLIAGPGGILIVVVLTNNNRFDYAEQAETALVLLAVLALVYAALRSAEQVLQRPLESTGITVASRIIGPILAALSVQMALTGIDEYF